MLFTGFAERQLAGDDGLPIFARVGGEGPPLVLLHGYPQTGAMWHAVAPRLAERFTVVVPDLRGYGRSGKPDGGGDHSAYSKRTMARDIRAIMATLGYERFAVAGHDRGGRVAYRLALDSPGAVQRLGILDIIPTIAQWRTLEGRRGIGGFHWFFLAQPPPLPETLIGAAPSLWLRTGIQSWAGAGFQFDAQALAEYEAAFSDPATIHGSCEDYRAGATIDVEYDAADEGKRTIDCPVLVLWGAARGPRPMLEGWKPWASDLRGQPLPCGHFLPEEAPEATANALLEFFSGG